MPERSLHVDGVICDLDGVIYRGSAPVQGAQEAIERLRGLGIPILFLTNNATATVEQRLERIRAFGIEASPEELLTSAQVTADRLVADGFEGANAFVIGKDGIRQALGDAGIHVVTSQADRVDVVVISGDDRFDYTMLRLAANHVRTGARLVAANDDATFPASDGLWPGAGAIVAAVEVASGRKAEVFGKPHPPMMEAAATRLPSCKHIAVVGDQPDTDLAGAHAMGWLTVLVLTGVTTDDDVTDLQPPPDLVVPSILEFARMVTR